MEVSDNAKTQDTAKDHKGSEAIGHKRKHEGGKVRRRSSPRASKENPPLVLIEWEDASHNRGGWKRYDEDETELGVVRSVGWLVQRDERFGWLIPHMMPESSTMHAQGCGDMTIPVKCVRSVMPLTTGQAGLG